MQKLENNNNIGIKHGFPCINVCQVLDRCYCINSTTLLKKQQKCPGTIFDLIAITLLIPTRTSHFYKNPRFRPWSSIVIFFQPLAVFHKFKSFSLTFSFNVACSVIFPQYPNLHNSYVNCFIDSFNCKHDASSVLLEYCPESCI